MIDLVPKVSALLWPTSLFVSVLLGLAYWLQPLLRRATGQGHVLFGGLAVIAVFVSVTGFVWLSVTSLAITTAVLVALGWVGRARRWGVANEEQPSGSDRRLALWIVLSLAVGHVFTDQAFSVHYDYYHSIARAIDLAIQGHSPSAWFSVFDPTYWFVTDQGLLPALDAIEAVLSGSISTSLSLLVVVVLALWSFRGIHASPTGSILWTLMLLAMLLDFGNAPRPHLVVGLLGAVVCCRMVAQAAPAEVGVYLWLMALAKRDGFVIALALAALYLLTYSVGRFGRTRSLVAAVVGAVGLGVLLSSFDAIGGRSPVGALVESVSRLDWASVARIPQVWVVVGAALVSGWLARRQRLPGEVFTVVAVFAGFVLLSVVLLDGLEQFNFGTIDRKIYYMFGPVLLLAVAATEHRATAVGAPLAAPTLPTVILVTLFSVWFYYYTPRVATVAPYDGYAGVLDAHRFLAGLQREFGPRVTLVTARDTGSRGLNREPEIGVTPMGGVSAYVFPYLAALNGTPFNVAGRASWCAAPPSDGLSLLSPAAAGPFDGVQGTDGLVAARLSSGYVLVLPRARFGDAARTFREELLSAESEMTFDPKDLTVQAGQIEWAERPWGAFTQYLGVSTTPSVTFSVGNWAENATRLTFEGHPLKAWPFQTLVLGYRDGRSVTITPGDLPDGVSVSVDLVHLATITATFGQDAYADPFRGYVFVMHAPALRKLDISPVSQFSFCQLRAVTDQKE